MSTDTTNFISNAQGVSDDCLFNLKPSSVRGRSYRASIPAQNAQTFAAGSTIIVSVPCGRRNSYLDTQQSYFRYTVKNSDISANYFDNNGYSVLNRLDTFSSGNKLETIQELGILAAYIFDMQTNPAQRVGLSTSFGFSSDITNPRQGLQIPASSQTTVCMPIMSSVCGVFCDKMIPIGRLSDDIRMEIVVADAKRGMVSQLGGSNWSIISFELVATIIELTDEGESVVESVSPRNAPLYLHSNSWAHNIGQITGPGQNSLLIPFRYASLKSIVAIPRRNTEIIDIASYSLSSRINPQIDSYQFRIGGSVVPNKQVYLNNTNNTGAYAEAFSEVLRAWHSLATPDACSSLRADYYNVNDAAITSTTVSGPSTGANSHKNGFTIAQELEVFSNRASVLLSGINTLGMNCYFDSYITALSLTATYNVNFFGNFDLILYLDPITGVMSPKM
jgi:hypothetical protein